MLFTVRALLGTAKQHPFFFWPPHTACGILVPWPGIEPQGIPNSILSQALPFESSPSPWSHKATLKMCALIIFKKYIFFYLWLNQLRKYKFWFVHWGKTGWGKDTSPFLCNKSIPYYVFSLFFFFYNKRTIAKVWSRKYLLIVSELSEAYPSALSHVPPP